MAVKQSRLQYIKSHEIGADVNQKWNTEFTCLFIFQNFVYKIAVEIYFYWLKELKMVIVFYNHFVLYS
jgi:hypothetical protein